MPGGCLGLPNAALAKMTVTLRCKYLLLLYDMDVSCHRPFLPGTSFEPAVIPTAQASSFTLHTFRIMCDVPSIAVFCSESIECFPGTASTFFLKLLVTIPVAPVITGIIVHFRFHVRCIAIHKLFYFNFFSTSFCTTFIIIIARFHRTLNPAVLRSEM